MSKLSTHKPCQMFAWIVCLISLRTYVRILCLTCWAPCRCIWPCLQTFVPASSVLIVAYQSSLVVVSLLLLAAVVDTLVPGCTQHDQRRCSIRISCSWARIRRWKASCVKLSKWESTLKSLNSPHINRTRIIPGSSSIWKKILVASIFCKLIPVLSFFSLSLPSRTDVASSARPRRPRWPGSSPGESIRPACREHRPIRTLTRRSV